MTLDYDLLSFDLTFKNNLPFSQCSPVKPEGHRHRYFFSVLVLLVLVLLVLVLLVLVLLLLVLLVLLVLLNPL